MISDGVWHNFASAWERCVGPALGKSAIASSLSGLSSPIDGIGGTYGDLWQAIQSALYELGDETLVQILTAEVNMLCTIEATSGGGSGSGCCFDKRLHGLSIILASLESLLPLPEEMRRYLHLLRELVQLAALQ